MKVSVMQDSLAKAIATVSRVVGQRTSLPVLGNILMRAEGSQLQLSATNLEIALTATISCKVEHPGALSVPARLLQETIQGLQSEKVQLTGSDTQLDIAAAGMKASLQGMEADEFPAIPEVTTQQSLSLATEDFRSTVSKVAIAASLDESRPVLAGVFLRTDQGVLTLAATDSYRLAECKIAVKKTDDLSVILPLRTIQEILRLIGMQSDSDQVQLELGTSEARITVENVTLVSRLIDGNFPNYTQIIPTKSETNVRCARVELAAAVKLASIFARESAYTIKLMVEKDTIKIHSEAAQVGENTSEVTCTLNGKATEISLNARFLQDVLGILETDEVELKLNDKLDACLIVPVDSDVSYLHIIMPLRS